MGHRVRAHLLGVLREGEEIIKEIFSRFNIKPEQIRRDVEGDRLFVEPHLFVGRVPSIC